MPWPSVSTRCTCGRLKSRQVLVVEGDAFAVLAVPRLELLGGRWVVDDLVDRARISSMISKSMMSSSSRCSGDEASWVLTQLTLVQPSFTRSTPGCSPVTQRVKFSTRSACHPAGDSGTIRRRWAVVAHTDRRRRALEDVELFGVLGQLRHGLHGSGPSPDDADFLAAQLVHWFGGGAAGVAVIPSARVEGVAFEGVDTRDAGKLGL